MNSHISKNIKHQNRSVAHTVAQKQQSGSSVLQEMANQSPQVKQLNALQAIADNSPVVTKAAPLNSMANTGPVQLFKGAVGTNQEGADIPFTFNQVFMDKHIATNEAGAIANTQARLDDAGDKGGGKIREGKIGNTVATNAVWTAAVNANTDVIPDPFEGPTPAEKLAPGFNAGDFDEDGRLPDSSYMRINAWEVTYDSDEDELSAEQKDVNRRVGGDYDVANLNVSLDIDHATQ